jgi:hypothetical protein
MKRYGINNYSLARITNAILEDSARTSRAMNASMDKDDWEGVDEVIVEWLLFFHEYMAQRGEIVPNRSAAD